MISLDAKTSVGDDLICHELWHIRNTHLVTMETKKNYWLILEQIVRSNLLIYYKVPQRLS